MVAPEALKIERKILIQAPRSRVWRALTNSREFGNWFSARVQGEFQPGVRMDMVSRHPGSNDKPFNFTIERMEPEHTFSWRWHPGSAKASEDGATLVEFSLQEVAGGTVVTVTETGFDAISIARRAKAFGENGRGWEFQMDALKKYASQAA